MEGCGCDWCRGFAADPYPRPLNDLARECHAENRRWYTDRFQNVTDEDARFTGAIKIALMHSELSEALEALRKNLMDDKLPHRRGEEVELADLLIRVFDYAGWRGLDLDGAVREKRAFNRTRADHTTEERAKENGKRF